MIIGCLLGFAPAAGAQTLTNIAEAANGDQLFVDRATLKTVPPLPGYRVFPATQIWATNSVLATRRSAQRTERFLFSFNCAQRTSLILVYQNNRTGIKLQDWRSADLDFKYEAPPLGSLAEFSMMFACSGGKLPVLPTRTEGEAEAEDTDAQIP